MNTMSAIIRKSMMFAIKSPYANVDFATLKDNFFKSPTSCKAKPTSGLIKSVTSAVTSFDEAAPITNAIASPITPNVFRKCTNSPTNPFFSAGCSCGLSDNGYVYDHIIIKLMSKNSN